MSDADRACAAPGMDHALVRRRLRSASGELRRARPTPTRQPGAQPAARDRAGSGGSIARSRFIRPVSVAVAPPPTNHDVLAVARRSACLLLAGRISALNVLHPVH